MPDAAFSFIRDFRLADAPIEVVDQAKSCLLDLIGVAAAGSQLAASRIIRSVAQSQFGGADGFFLFDGRGASPAGAALANATTIDGFDAHDGHPLTKGHAGCGSLAGLLAFAGRDASISGAEALGHLIAGYEVAIRAGMALHATAAEYHTSGAWVSLGAAAIGARMLGLDRAATREALGIAEYNGPRSQMMRCIDHPAMIKDGSGWGAMTGVMAAFLARDGFTGAPAVTVEGDDVAGLWADIGARWRIREQYFKPYPVCRWAQPAMEAVAQLQRDHHFGHAEIEKITVRTFFEASRLATPQPRTTDAAQYSLPFPVAALLVRGKVGPAEIEGEALDDPDILRLSRLTELIDDPALFRAVPCRTLGGSGNRACRRTASCVEAGSGARQRRQPALRARAKRQVPRIDGRVRPWRQGATDRGHGDGHRSCAIDRAADRSADAARRRPARLARAAR